MTRFDASDPKSRRSLYVDAIAAHRDRGSQFLTIEVDESALGENPETADLGVPWLQFAEGIVNLDCTDDELERLKSLLSEFPAFSIDELTRPEDTDGVNVRVSAAADPDRIAQFLERVIQTVYAFPDTTRVWVVEL
ncbi:hypothetical protein EL22_22140 [Halostagnicola sp. A56]|uniref:hypothetical protein n=1 Tax=Halostagnicola sp. A56 TaxID=1495067 RepID=UPI0004A0A1EA|nr:hypothetical protein [Halostagnicola sp. A56]KDE60437.1 hypothetical protein EL22_22140 [Halostagnicola sp. A56]